VDPVLYFKTDHTFNSKFLKMIQAFFFFLIAWLSISIVTMIGWFFLLLIKSIFTMQWEYGKWKLKQKIKKIK